MSSVTWSDGKVGYDPGQSQSIKLTFKEREQGRVQVTWSFYAKSLGQDDYTGNQRWNKVSIWAGTKLVTSFTYQLHGYMTSTSRSDTVDIYGIKNDVSSLDIQYENLRLGTNTPNYGPKSTGKHTKGTIGALKIPAVEKYTVTFKYGYKGGKVSGLPSNITKYSGTEYKIPSDSPIDSLNHYVFNKGYTDSENIISPNTKTPNHKINTSYKLTEDIFLTACWKPQTYTYNFYKTGTTNRYTKLNKTYTYASQPIYLPNLNEFTQNNSKNDGIYYYPGYNFKGWTCQTSKKTYGIDVRCKEDSLQNTIKFSAIWEPIKGNITFDYGFNDYTRVASYTFNTNFDFKTVRKKQNETASTTAEFIRPGYKLIGWTSDRSLVYDSSSNEEIIYGYGVVPKELSYFEDSNMPIKITVSNRRFEEIGMTLYAVWQYSTAIYVYTNNVWKLALPYVYTNGTWKLTLAYAYVNESGNYSWKL